MGAGVTLAPPLWATGSWATDAWLDGSWATEISAPTEFGDLSTLFMAYVDTLRDASALAALDSTSLVAADLPTVRSGNGNLDDANTMYAEHLS